MATRGRVLGCRGGGRPRKPRALPQFARPGVGPPTFPGNFFFGFWFFCFNSLGPAFPSLSILLFLMSGAPPRGRETGGGILSGRGGFRHCNSGSCLELPCPELVTSTFRETF